jgi:hypothetical protein
MALGLQYILPMMDKRLLGIASLATALGSGACGLGEADTVAGPDINAVVCHTDLAITGTMVPGAKPADYDPDLGDTNCWPVGVWTFTAAPKAVNDDGSPQCTGIALLPEYKVQVVRDYTSAGADGAETYSFLTDAAAKSYLKVSSGGGGLCEGVFQVFSADGKTIHNLHPALQPAPVLGGNHPLTGHGEYTVFVADQWIP